MEFIELFSNLFLDASSTLTVSTSIINNLLLLSAVIGLGALGGYFCERAGIINIAIDGQMIFGAMWFSIFGLLFNQWFPNTGGMLFLVPLLLTVLVSPLLSLVFGWLTIKLKVNHIIAGTAVNLVVAGLATFLTKPLGSAISNGKYPKLFTDFIPQMKIGDSSLFGETIIIFVLALIAIVIFALIMKKTKFGLRFKAVGDNPNAVDAQGLNVIKLQWTGMFVSGAISSLAGALFIYGGITIGAPSQYFEGNVLGMGFLSVAIVVSGGWRIPWMSLASLVFATLICVFQSTAVLHAMDIKSQYAVYIGKSIPFIFSLVALAIFSRKNTAPLFLGKNFDKELR